MKLCLPALVLFALAACTAPEQAPSPSTGFATPQAVTIEGYKGDAMEPFLSRDGAVLLFNNRNDPAAETDLHWATRIDDLHFAYRGKIATANSADLDGVPTLAASSRLCFVSTRAYAATLATVYCGAWADGAVSALSLQRKAAPLIPGRLIFDVELDATGDTMIVADGRFTGGPIPVSADLRLARWQGEYVLDPAADALFAAVNTNALEYAAGLSADGLALCFTRIGPDGPSLWIAHRARPDQPFETPQRIEVATGFVEAGTFAPDGALYFHRLTNGRFTLWRSGKLD